MTKTFAAVLAISLMLLSLMSCNTSQGVTLSVSLTGQPNGGQTNVGAVLTLLPSIYYRGSAPDLNVTYNVLSAPDGGIATFNPRTQIVSTSGAGAVPVASTLSFSSPGTYVVQVVVQETGSGDLEASDQTTFTVLPAANG